MAKASYEVVPRDKAPKIELLDIPELRQQVLAAVKLDSVSQQKDGYLNVQFQLTRVPCDVAFDVFVQTDTGETKTGSISCAKGKSTGCGTGDAAPKQLPAKVKVILRSSVDVAKNTVDETAIYSGEILFPDVVVKQETY
jgi:hypothetical protein